MVALVAPATGGYCAASSILAVAKARMRMNKPADISVDHRDIMRVIERETETFVARDYEGWAECWVQDERTQDVCISPDFGVTVLDGWDQLSGYIHDVLAKGSGCDVSEFKRENVQVSVQGSLAHVTFEGQSMQADGRVEQTFETRILEQQANVWRVRFALFALRGHLRTDASRLAIDAQGKVVCAPPDAVQRLEAQKALLISNGRLRAARPSWDKVLQEGIERTADVHGYFQQYRYAAQTGRNFRLPLVLGEDDAGGVIVCTLFVRDDLTFVELPSETDVAERLQLAKAIFGLSDGQLALTERIVSGDGLTAAAEKLGISINTARTHLQRTYVKTGVNTQTALVRTLLSVG